MFSGEDSLMELVWENGQIMMQDQSSRAKKTPNNNDSQLDTPRVRDKYTGFATSTKLTKFDPMETSLGDCPVPSGDTALSPSDDVVPWLNYNLDPLDQDYGSVLLPEVSSVTEPAALDKRSNCYTMNGNFHGISLRNGGGLEQRNAGNASSSRFSLFSSQQGQTSQSLGSGFSDVITGTSDKNPDSVFRDSSHLFSSKTQKANTALAMPSSSSGLLNFTNFARPVFLAKRNPQGSEEMAAARIGKGKVPDVNSIKPMKAALVEPSSSNFPRNIDFLSQPSAAIAKLGSQPFVTPTLEKPGGTEPTNVVLQEHQVKNDKDPCQTINPGATKGFQDGERTVEPAVASSSVCSVGSVDRPLNDQSTKLKRKSRDSEDSDSQKREAEEESAVKNHGHTRGMGSKRTRAAEVHNLSERRRRDRINEKMRALQELIPNCNRADKASMLDEAIEYLKTLQFQVQMMSMGAGLCMPPMMFPPGMQHMHAAPLPHFSPMGVGMGMGMGMGLGMGFGMGMLDMNNGSPRYPIFPLPRMQQPHFPSQPISGPATFQGITGTHHPSQGLPVSVVRTPPAPLPAPPTEMGLHASTSTTCLNVEAPNTDPSLSSKGPVSNQNLQPLHSPPGPKEQVSRKASNESLDRSNLVQRDNQAPDVSGSIAVSSINTSDVVTRRETGCDISKKKHVS